MRIIERSCIAAMHGAFLLLSASRAFALQAEPSAERQVVWNYVVPPDGAPFRDPPESALLLVPDVPEGLELAFDRNGRDLWFAQLRYGDAGSVRIAVAVERRKDGDPLLYVDADRSRTLEERERIEGKDGRWETTLSVSTADVSTGPVPRRVSFRLSSTGLLLGYATLGFCEGSVEIDGRRCAARLVDADGNGFMTDARDRIWIDLDGDGRWSPFEEQFPCAPVLRLKDARYALRSDRLGTRMSAEKIEGFGRVRLRLCDASGHPRQDVQALRSVLVGKDGSAVGVDGHDMPVEAPVGEYRIGMVMITLADAKNGDPWSFVFSEPGGDRELAWRTLPRDGELVIDPIGTLDFQPHFQFEADAVQAGDKLIVTPSLHTADGLLVNTSSRRASGWGSELRARTLLEAPGGAVLDQSDSGFA